MATTLQAKIESLGEKLREENKSRECELLGKNDERSTCSKKPHLSLDFDASTRQPRPGKWIEVVYATMRRLSEVLVCSYETACEELSLFISEKSIFISAINRTSDHGILMVEYRPSFRSRN